MYLVCGEALFDVFIENAPALDVDTIEFSARVGGSPFNVAVGLARLGRESALMTGVSTDFLGDRLKAVLEKEKVSTDYLFRKSGPTTLGFVQKSKSGHPSYAFYGNGAADRSLVKEDIPHDITFVRCIHLGSYSIVVPPTADTLEALIKRESGKRIISLDPNIRPTVESEMDVWRMRVSRLLPFVDVIKASDEDLGLLYPEVQPEDVLQMWLSSGVQLAAITMGEHGALLGSQKAHVQIDSPLTQVIDTVGAGDTFQAALLDQVVSLANQNKDNWIELLDTQALKNLGRFAVGAAAITCSRKGADLPSRDEVYQFLANYQ